jgi:hypothetical protein
VNSDDRRLAKASRLLRRRAGLRQVEMPSRWICQEIEAGRSGSLTITDVRSHFRHLDAAVYINAWWNGAALDRLIDSRHAAVVDSIVAVLTSASWRALTEYTFATHGERGAIDVFGGRDDARAVFVGEAKSEWGSIEETLRRLHVKVRLAPRLAVEAFGWRPLSIGAALVFPDDRTARRIAERFAATLDAALPARSRDVRRWIQQPTGDLRGLWFLTNAAGARTSRT